MGENSGIQWTHHTFNGWWGCQRVSPGCQHCYAEALDKRVGGGVDPADGKKKLRWGATAPRLRTSPANWKQPLRWDRDAQKAGERRRVFCSSMADVFEDRPELVPWRLDLFQLIALTPNLDWLLLTKRPENIDRMLPRKNLQHLTAETWPNVWLGTTVEDQQRANERIPELVKVPAAVRFLSCEPLLELVDLDQAVAVPGGEPCGLKCARERGAGIDWIIIGGESGGGARPFGLDWARSLVRQARRAGVAPFVKQLGACASDARNGIAGASLKVPDEAAQLISRRLTDRAGGDMAEWPEDLRVREFPEVRR